MERESSSESNNRVSEESCHSSVVTKFEADGEEVQSPRTSHKGFEQFNGYLKEHVYIYQRMLMFNNMQVSPNLK